jgi:outer membrane protein assembly factor BamB
VTRNDVDEGCHPVRMFLGQARDLCDSAVPDYPLGPVAVADGSVYACTAGNRDNLIYSLNSTTGHSQWSYPVPVDAAALWPAVADGVVYDTPNNNENGVFALFALDASTGKLLWKYNTGAILSDPVVVNGFVYVGSGTNVDAFSLPTAKHTSQPPPPDLSSLRSLQQ